MKLVGTKNDLINKWKKRENELRKELGDKNGSREKIIIAKINMITFCINNLEILEEKKEKKTMKKKLSMTPLAKKMRKMRKEETPKEKRARLDH